MMKVIYLNVLRVLIISLVLSFFALNVFTIVTEEDILIDAEYNNDIGFIDKLIETGINPSAKDERGYTPIHIAVENKNIDSVIDLLNSPKLDLEYRLP